MSVKRTNLCLDNGHKTECLLPQGHVSDDPLAFEVLKFELLGSWLTDYKFISDCVVWLQYRHLFQIKVIQFGMASQFACTVSQCSALGLLL